MKYDKDGRLLSLTFNNSECVPVVGDLVTYIPDEFKYARDGFGGNQHWMYIVPKDYSLDLDHIDAKPMSFGIIPISIGTLPGPADKDYLDSYKEFLRDNNVLQYGVAIYDCICSDHCMFIYQRWNDYENNTYNKINGVLLADDQVYQFHTFMNYDRPISSREDVIRQFELMSRQWMKHVVLSGDSIYKPKGDPAEVTATLNDLSRLVKKCKEVLLSTLSDEFGSDITESYASIARLFYQDHNIPIDSSSLHSINNMLGRADNQELPDVKFASITDLLRAPLHDRVMKQLVMTDKVSERTMGGGITIVHSEGVKELLKVLCQNNDIDYDLDLFSMECVETVRDLFNEKWSGISTYSLDESTMVIHQHDSTSYAMNESTDVTDSEPWGTPTKTESKPAKQSTESVKNEPEIANVAACMATGISVGETHVVGLKSDGTVMAVGDNDYGETEVDGWEDIIAVSAAESHTVGLKSNGTVVAVGDNDIGELEVDDWNDIVAVAAGPNHTIGLKSDGTVVATPILWDGCDKGQTAINDWKDIIAISTSTFHTVGLKSDGTVIATYITDDDCDEGQAEVNEWEDIIAISAAVNHTVGLRSDGTVVAAGINDANQIAVDVIPDDWKDIIAISTSKYYTVGLKKDGTVSSVGQYGYQLAEVSDWKNIVAISAGQNYVVGLKSDGTVLVSSFDENLDPDELGLDSWTDIVNKR